MMHYHFYILDNHHQIKESLRLEENRKNTKINNLVSVKKGVDFIHSDYFRVPKNEKYTQYFFQFSKDNLLTNHS